MTPPPPPPPPSVRCFLLFAFLSIFNSTLYGRLVTAAASESEDNGANEQDLVYLPNANSESEEALSGKIRVGPRPHDSPPFSTSSQSFLDGLNYTINGKFNTRMDLDLDSDLDSDLDTDRLDRYLEEGVTWPWVTNITKAPTVTPAENSCASRASCDECNSMGCHWCVDNKCHTKGSVYGCTVGMNCRKNHTKPDGPDGPDDLADKSCGAHSSCTDCVLSSHLCHWCASDDACHEIGSWYGCAHGTDCYTNDRCQRPQPDPIKTDMLSDIGYVPILLITSIGICSFFCSSVVYGGVKALKGAYEDLAHARAPMQSDRLPGVHVGRDYSVEVLVQGEEEKEGEDRYVHGHEDATKVEVVAEAVKNSTDNRDNSTDTESLLQLNRTSPVTAHPDPSRIPRGRTGSQNMTCLLKLCQLWYISTIMGTIFIVTLSFYCFPRMPQYNLCADEFAWKSIISGLTSLKLEASFELLISIENKNHLNITLEGFSGKIDHDGGEVGSFQLPKSAVVASSITDVLVTVTVIPNKWEALGLISEYYKGSLILSMSVNGAVKVTGIYYSFPVKVTDVIVRVNDPSKSDRHLCACPEWKDLRPTMTLLPEFLIDHDQKSAMTIF